MLYKERAQNYIRINKCPCGHLDGVTVEALLNGFASESINALAGI